MLQVNSGLNVWGSCDPSHILNYSIFKNVWNYVLFEAGFSHSRFWKMDFDQCFKSSLFNSIKFNM